MRLICSIILAFTLAGCALFTKAPAPLKGGRASIAGSAPSATAPASVSPTATIESPENPQTPTKQTSSEKAVTTYTFPTATTTTTETKQPDGTTITVTEVIPAGTKKTVNNAREVVQEIGSAQKDTSREITAKMASMKPVQFVGIALLLAAAAMFHPVVRTAVGAGKEFQAATAAIGLALVFGPSLFVGNERLILIVGLLSALGIYGLSRLSYYKAKHDAAASSPNGS